MGQFERDVLAGKYPHLRIDPDSPWIDREGIDLTSPPGTKIVFHGQGGNDHDRERAADLVVGSAYTVNWIKVDAWSSKVALVEFPDPKRMFNTVLFEKPRSLPTDND